MINKCTGKQWTNACPSIPAVELAVVLRVVVESSQTIALRLRSRIARQSRRRDSLNSSMNAPQQKAPQNHLASQISGGSYQYYCCTTMIPSRTGCQPRSGGHFLSLQRSRPRRNTPLCTLPGLIVLYLQGIFLAFGPQISRLSGTNWHVTIIWRCHGTEILLNLIWSPGSCSRVPPLP